MLLYIAPVVLSFIIFTTRQYCLKREKRKHNNNINDRNTQVFKKLRKTFQKNIKQEKATAAAAATAAIEKQEVINIKANHQNQPPPASPSKINKSVKKGRVPDINSFECQDHIDLLETIRWEDIQVGDIICLKKDEIAPADLLILDMSTKFCTVDCQLINGQIQEQIKHPVLLTSVAQNSKLKQSVFEYRKMLQGKVEFSKHGSKRDFKGFVKLTKDPKGEEVGVNNMIYRGSVVKFCDQLYGLVIFCGFECKIFQYSKAIKHDHYDSFFGKKAKVFYFVSYIHVIINCLLSMFFLYYQPCSHIVKMSPQDDYFIMYFFSYMADYLHFLPPFYYMIMDIVDLINDLYNIKKFNQNENDEAQKAKSQQQQQEKLHDRNRYKLNRPVSIGDLSVTNHVFIDKTGTLTSDQSSVKMIIINGTMYKFSRKKMTQVMKEYKFPQQNHDLSIKEIYTKDLTDFKSEEKNMNEQPIQVRQFENVALMSNASGSLRENSRHGTAASKDYKGTTILNNNFDEDDVLNQVLPHQRHPSDSELDVMGPIGGIKLNGGSQNFDNPNSQSQQVKRVNNGGGSGEAGYQGGAMGQANQQGSDDVNTNKDLNTNQTPTQRKRSKVMHQSDSIDEHIYNIDQFLKRLYEEQELMHHETMLALNLCHNHLSRMVRGGSSGELEDKIQNYSMYKHDVELQRFSKQLGYEFRCSSTINNIYSPNYIVQIQTKFIKYPILAINENTSNRDRVSVLFRDPNSLTPGCGSILYLKQQVRSLPQYVDIEKTERERVDNRIRQMEMKGNKCFLICKRELTEEDTNEYLSKYENLRRNLVSDVAELDNLFNSVEINMKLLTIVGIKDKLRKGCIKCIQNMQNAEIHVWMLTGDSGHNSIPIAYQSKIMDTESNMLHFEGQNMEAFKVLIKTYLNLLKNCLKDPLYSQSLQSFNLASPPKDQPIEGGTLNQADNIIQPQPSMNNTQKVKELKIKLLNVEQEQAQQQQQKQNDQQIPIIINEEQKQNMMCLDTPEVKSSNNEGLRIKSNENMLLLNQHNEEAQRQDLEGQGLNIPDQIIDGSGANGNTLGFNNKGAGFLALPPSSKDQQSNSSQNLNQMPLTPKIIDSSNQQIPQKMHRPSNIKASFIQSLLIDQQQQQIGNNSATINNGRSPIRKTVTNVQLKKRMTQNFMDQKIPLFTIVVSGEALQLILSDKYLRTHFQFLSYFSTGLVGYGLTAQQKAQMVMIVKQRFPGNLRTLAIGDSYNDSSMMESCDLSIQIERQDRRINCFGDIIVKDFHTIQLLLFSSSRYFAEMQEEILLFTFYEAFLMGYIILIYNFYDCSYGSSIFDAFQIFWYHTFYYTVSVTLYLIKKYRVKTLTEMGSKDINHLVEQYYTNIKIFKKQKTMTFFNKVIIHSLTESLILYFMLYYEFNRGSDINGKTYTLKSMQLVGLLLVGYWSIIKMMVASAQGLKEGILGFIFFAIFSIIYLPLEKITKYNPYAFIDIQELIFQTTNIPIFFFSIYLFQVAFNIFLEYNLFIPTFFPQTIIREYKLLKDLKDNFIYESQHSRQLSTVHIQKRKKNSVEVQINRLLSLIFKNGQGMDAILHNLLSSDDSNVQASMNQVQLKFTNNDLEKKFEQFLIKQWFKINFGLQIISVIGLEAALIIIKLNNVQQIPEDEKTQWLVINLVVVILMLFLLLMMSTSRGQINFFSLSMYMFLIRLIGKVILNISITTDNSYETVLYSQVFNLAILGRPDYILYASFIQNCTFIIKYLIVVFDVVDGLHFFVAINILFYCLSFFIYSSLSKYQYEEMERNDYLSQNNLSLETSKINGVLAILLPKFVRDRVNDEGQINLAENQGDVAIVFCNICDFHDMLSYEGQRIVSILDNLFKAFDTVCIQNEMTKIETVGNSYVASAGLKSVEEGLRKKLLVPNAVERSINFAFDLMDQAKQKSWGENQKIKLRIGIHYGRIIAGVIGYHKPQFSLIGDTINTTSRVMSTGEDGKIQISEQAFNQVKHLPHTFKKRCVEAKGKGVITTYQVFRANKLHNKKTNKHTQMMAQIQPKARQFKLIMNGSNSPTKHAFQNQKFDLMQELNGEDKKDGEKDQSGEGVGQGDNQALLVKPSRKKSKSSIKLNNEQQEPVAVNINNDLHLQQQKLQMLNINDINPVSQLSGSNTKERNTRKRNTFRFMQQEENQRRSKQKIKLSEEDIKHPSQQLQPQPQQYIPGSGHQHLVMMQAQQSQLDVQSKGQIDKQESNAASKPQKETSMMRIEQGIGEQIHIEPLSELQDRTVDVDRVQEIYQVDEEKDVMEVKTNFIELSPKLLYLRLERSELVQEFFLNLYKEGNTHRSIKFYLLIIIQFIKAIMTLVIKDNLGRSFGPLVGLRFSYVGCLIGYIVVKKSFFDNNLNLFRIFLYFFYILMLGVSTYETFVIDLDINLPESQNMLLNSIYRVQTIEVFFVFVICSSFRSNQFTTNIVMYVVLLIVWIIISSHKDFIKDAIYFILLGGMVNNIFQYIQLRLQIKHFNSLRVLKKKMSEKSTLLRNLLPTHILENFFTSMQQAKRFDETDVIDNVTILFADIANFTKYSGSVEPEQVVYMLKNLFTEFDKSCQDFGLLKLYTIGDCYVVLGFTDKTKRNPVEEAKNVVYMGFAMIEIIAKVRAIIKFEDLDMRIGVHTGQIIGGVIGTDIVRYDIFGKDVVIANKMESSGERGRVLVSKVTKELLEQNYKFFNFEKREEDVHCKSINTTIEAYFISVSEELMNNEEEDDDESYNQQQ